VVQTWPTRAKRIYLQIRTFRAKFVVRRHKRKRVKGRAVARRGDDRGAQELTIGSPSIERVRFHADLTILGRLALELARARAVPLAA
jgi:hypothetical protein